MMAMPIINMVQTGQKIEFLRKEAGLSVKELQEIFGFDDSGSWQTSLSRL